MKEKILNVIKSNLLFALILNSAILAICIIFTSFSYDNINDYTNSIFISQKHFYYNGQINYLLAIIVGTAQYVFPDFNCFVLAQVMLSWAGFCAITFVFADKFNKKKAFVFSILFNIFFSLEHYKNINGNRTAALLFLAGFLLVLNAIYNKRYSLPCWIGVVMIAFGSFFNYIYFYVALGFAVAFFFGDMISKKKFKLPFRKFFWYFRPFLLMFLLVTVVVFGLNSFSYSVNNATDEAKNYYEYSTLQSQISNEEFPSYNEFSDEFAEVGINNEYEYNLLKGGYFDNEQSLNTDALKKIAEIQQKINTKNILTSIADVLSNVSNHFVSFDNSAIIILSFVACGIIFVIFQKNRFGFFPVFYLVTGFAASVVLNFVYNNSDSLNYGIWLFMSVLLFYSLNFEKSRNNEIPNLLKIKYGNIIISCVAVLIVGTTYFAVYPNIQTNRKSGDIPMSMFSEIERNPHKYYVFDTETSNSFIKFTENYLHPLWGFRDGYIENIDTFGYFHNNEMLTKRNLPTNIFEAVLTKNEIYVVDNGEIKDKESYFTEHYSQNGQKITYQQINELDGYKIYRVFAE